MLYSFNSLIIITTKKQNSNLLYSLQLLLLLLLQKGEFKLTQNILFNIFLVLATMLSFKSVADFAKAPLPGFSAHYWIVPMIINHHDSSFLVTVVMLNIISLYTRPWWSTGSWGLTAPWAPLVSLSCLMRSSWVSMCWVPSSSLAELGRVAGFKSHLKIKQDIQVLVLLNALRFK